MSEIIVKYVYSDGDNSFNKVFDITQIENGDPIDEICDSPLLKKYKIIARLLCSGIKDKHGVKIFEGSKVSIIHPCWEAKCITEIIDGSFIFRELNNPVRNATAPSYSCMREKWELEVTGNIHDKKKG